MDIRECTVFICNSFINVCVHYKDLKHSFIKRSLLNLQTFQTFKASSQTYFRVNFFYYWNLFHYNLNKIGLCWQLCCNVVFIFSKWCTWRWEWGNSRSKYSGHIDTLLKQSSLINKVDTTKVTTNLNFKKIHIHTTMSVPLP